MIRSVAVACVLMVGTGASAAPSTGKFVGALVTAWNGDGRHMTLTQPFAYVASDGEAWPVPKGTMVDGASIPKPLWSIIGGPFEGLYRNASVIHDYYCDVRLRPWQDVDRMFYEAMRTSGVPDKQARLMYLAVVYAGPHWDFQAIHNQNLPHPELSGNRVSKVTVSRDYYAAMQSEAFAQERAAPAARGLAFSQTVFGGADVAADKPNGVVLRGPFTVVQKFSPPADLAVINIMAARAEQEHMDLNQIDLMVLNQRSIAQMQASDAVAAAWPNPATPR